MVSIDQNLFLKEQYPQETQVSDPRITSFKQKSNLHNTSWLSSCKNLAIATGILTTFGASYSLYQNYQYDLPPITSETDFVSGLVKMANVVFGIGMSLYAVRTIFEMVNQPGPSSGTVKDNLDGSRLIQKTGSSFCGLSPWKNEIIIS